MQINKLYSSRSKWELFHHFCFIFSLCLRALIRSRESLRSCRPWVKNKANQEPQYALTASRPSLLLCHHSPQELLIIKQKLMTSPFLFFLGFLFFLSFFFNPLHKHSLENIFCSCLCVTHLFSLSPQNNGPWCLLSEAGAQLCFAICLGWWDIHTLLLSPGTCLVAPKMEPDKAATNLGGQGDGGSFHNKVTHRLLLLFGKLQ